MKAPPKDRGLLPRILISLASVFVLMVGAMNREVEAQNPPQENDVFPDLILPMPKRFQERQYLGIAPEGKFKVSDIQAQVLVVQMFSMYCPYCQKDAPNVNTLHDIVRGRPDTRDAVKIIGIGVGNTSFEVKAFRELYSITFPLFADEDQRLHKALGEVPTPYFFALRMRAGKPATVIYSDEGSFGDPEEFLELILDASRAEGGGQ